MKKLLCAFAVAAMAFAGCSKEDEVIVDTIVLESEAVELVFTYSDTADKTVSFTASADWTVTVDADWVGVTPASGAAGEGTLTVSLQEEAEPTADRQATATIVAGNASAEFTIVQQARDEAINVQISAATTQLRVGESVELTAQPIPTENRLPEAAVWSSSDPAVVAVSEVGVATAVAEGSAEISVKSGALEAKLTITVKGHTYSFADLAAAENAVVKKSGANEYTVTDQIIVGEGDKLTLNDGETIIFDNAELRIEGYADFAVENRATIKASEPSKAKTIYCTAGGYVDFANLDVIGVPVRLFGDPSSTFTACAFTGYESTSYDCITLGGCAPATVTGCRFVGNSRAAISSGANTPTGLLFKDNYLEKNGLSERNAPQINMTVGGDEKVEIIGNTIVGPAVNTKVGGISVANMMGIAGTNEVLIEGNKVTDCRYGITTTGALTARIIDNVLENNKYDASPMSGGSGVSLSNSTGGQRVYMRGNTIKGSLWGITSIGNVAKGVGPELNMGNVTVAESDPEYNPGGNVFADNGNGGVLYDLYNNSPMDVMAQGNTWGVAEQTKELIETVIFHKADNASFGEVNYWPAATK